MGLVELFLAVLVVGFSAINAGVPFAAWGRARDGRFALLGAGHLGLAALGAIWVWGAWGGTPPPSAVAPWPILTLVVAVVLLWFAATLWRPRR